jgi:predicted transcriptional regulator
MFGGEEALEHKTRKQIYNYISTHPGVSFGVIRRFFDINESTLKYHLHYLEKNQRITSERTGRQRCYYSEGVQKTSEQYTMQLQHKAKQLNLSMSQQRVLSLIRQQPGITRKELIKFTKLKRKTLSYRIDKLIEHQLIWKVKTEEGIGYEFITKEKLRKEIYNQLLLKLLADEISEEKFLKIKKKLELIDIDEI